MVGGGMSVLGALSATLKNDLAQFQICTIDEEQAVPTYLENTGSSVFGLGMTVALASFGG